MNIYYQGNPGSYMYSASLAIQPYLSENPGEIIGKTVFKDVWEQIALGNIGVLAIENSYMGSIHPNLYGFLKYDCKIIGEYYGAIDHCLCSREDHKSKIQIVYSQSPALEQCYKYIHEFNMESRECSDTALSAKIAAQSDEPGVAGICSELAAKLYGLNILDRNIQDQKDNTTRFAIIATNNSNVNYSQKSHKISIIFEARDIPSSLHKCLGAFANNNINLSKIESLPSYTTSFSYHFWIDFSGNLAEKKVQNALSQLKKYTSSLRIVGEY